MNDYNYETIYNRNGYELQQKYIIEMDGRRVYLSYRIKHNEEVSKPYFNRKNAIKAHVNAYIDNKIVK